MNKNLFILLGACTTACALAVVPVGRDLVAPLADAIFVAVMFCSLYLFMACLSGSVASIWKDMPRLSMSLAALRCGLGIYYSLMLLAGTASRPLRGVVFQIGSVITPQNIPASLALYALLIVMNVFVIMKGLTRIAEVMARFSLDSLPGRQLSVDAELSAGVISPQQAEKKREAISGSAAFYAAMDGCSKFLKGEFTCSVFVFILQVVCVAAERSLAPAGGNAASSDLLLLLSAAIVLQVPAALAGGACCLAMLADNTRVAESGGARRHFAAMLVVSGASIFCSLLINLVPGPTVTLGLIIPPVLCVLALRRLRATGETTPSPEAPRAAPPGVQAAALTPVRVEIGPELLGLFIGPEAFLQERVYRLRTNVHRTMGLKCPSIRVVDNPSLPGTAYRVFINEVEQTTAYLNPGDLLAIKPADEARAFSAGSSTLDPVFGLPASWIRPSLAAEAVMADCQVLDCMTLFFLHLNELISHHMDELVSPDVTQQLLSDLQQSGAGEIVRTYQTQPLSGTLQWIVQALAFERVPLRYPLLVLEALSNVLPSNGADNAILLEHVRQRLKRQICRDHADAQGMLNVVYVSQPAGDRLAGPAGRGSFLPEEVKELLQVLRRLALEEGANAGFALVVPASVRLALYGTLRRLGLMLPVLSHQEIVPEVPVRVLAVL